MKYLVADVGGTNTRFALAHCHQPAMSLTLSQSDSVTAMPPEIITLEQVQPFKNHDFDNFSDILATYLKTLSLSPKQLTKLSACFGVAGPCYSDQATLSNLDWTLSTSKLLQQFKVKSIQLINDFSTIAASLPFLDRQYLDQLTSSARNVTQYKSAQAQNKTTLAVMGPGTGLGMGFTVYRSPQWLVIPSEGGNAGFTPNNTLEVELLAYARKQLGFVSKESLLSGRGLLLIYQALQAFSGTNNNHSNSHPSHITKAALAGSDAIAQQTIEVFWDMIASHAGDLALTAMATDGLFLAGGILPRLTPLLDRERFQTIFTGKGSFHELLEQVECLLIAPESHCALVGAAAIAHKLCN